MVAPTSAVVVPMRTNWLRTRGLTSSTDVCKVATGHGQPWPQEQSGGCVQQVAPGLHDGRQGSTALGGRCERWSESKQSTTREGNATERHHGPRDEAVLRRLELLGGRHFVPQVTGGVSRSTRGPLGGVRFWDVQHTVSENHGWVEVARLPAGGIAGVRPPDAWLLLQGMPIGLVAALDLSILTPFSSWSGRSALADVVAVRGP